MICGWQKRACDCSLCTHRWDHSNRGKTNFFSFSGFKLTSRFLWSTWDKFGRSFIRPESTWTRSNQYQDRFTTGTSFDHQDFIRRSLNITNLDQSFEINSISRKFFARRNEIMNDIPYHAKNTVQTEHYAPANALN